MRPSLGCGSVADHLPSMCKALGLISALGKRRRKELKNESNIAVYAIQLWF